MAAVAVAVRNKRKQRAKEYELQQDAISRAGSEPGSDPNAVLNQQFKLKQIPNTKVNTLFMQIGFIIISVTVFLLTVIEVKNGGRCLSEKM